MPEQFAIGVDFKDVVLTIHGGPCFAFFRNKSIEWNRSTGGISKQDKSSEASDPNLQSFELCCN
jgi:hypothetical protein